MKKLTTLWMMILMLCISIPASAMSRSKVRENARFLTDRMAYELNLSSMQYDDVYEVNYDFIDNVRHIMDDVVRGHDYAVDRYYEFLDYRNDDLRWILSASQYRRFMGVDYFYRPIYTTASDWLFRIYKVYRDVTHFYFDKPHHYKSYKGAHYRIHYGNVSFYKNNRKNHYKHDFYQGDIRARKDKAAPKMDARPKGNARPAPGRKEVKPSDVKRTSDVKRSSESTARRPVNEKKEVKREAQPSGQKEMRKESQPNRRTEVKKEVKKENGQRNGTSTRSSRGENQEGRRAKR